MWALLRNGRGKAPRTYVYYEVMRHMGWSWRDLQEAPVHVVRDILRYMRTEARYQEHQERRVSRGQ